MKIWIVVLSLIAAGLAGGLVYQLAHERRLGPSPVVAATPPVESAAAAAAPAIAAAPGQPDVRAQIRQAVETDVTPLKSESDLDRYLASLEARARRNHKVTALEVEPGIRAIRNLADQIGPDRMQEKRAAFTQKMARLSAEFDGRDHPQPPTDFDALAHRIEHSSGAERDALLRRFDQAAQELSPDERIREHDRLNRLTASAR
jgi:hypothetical protein